MKTSTKKSRLSTAIMSVGFILAALLLFTPQTAHASNYAISWMPDGPPCSQDPGNDC